MGNIISLHTAELIGRQAASVLALLAISGVIAGIVRWRSAVRPQYLLAFIIFLVGTTIAQLPVYLGGMVGWGVDLILLSAVGRLVQDVGAVLFIRAALREQCGVWGWRTVLCAVLLLSLVI